MTGLLDSLERRGFVQRSAHPTDRLSLIVAVTPAGLDVLHKVRSVIHRNEKAWMSGFAEADLRAYIEQLHRIQDRLAADA